VLFIGATPDEMLAEVKRGYDGEVVLATTSTSTDPVVRS
jgi:hypothetical protein